MTGLSTEARSIGASENAAAPSPASRSSTSRTVLYLQAGLFMCMFLIYLVSPVLQIIDSKYSILTAESIIRNGTPDLSTYSIKNYEQDLPFNTIRGLHAYQLVRINGRLIYGFPLGTSFLSLPFVAIMDMLGVSPAAHDKKFDLAGEVLDQKLLAAILMALLVVVFFRTSLILLDWRWSATIAIGAGLGTQLWSTGSRGMWSNTWEMMLAGLVVYILLNGEVRCASIRPIILSTLSAWMLFVRPTAIAPIACLSVYLFLFRRAEFLTFATAGATWLCIYMVYTISILGSPFGPYYHQLWAPDLRSMGIGLFGTLLSPSRGLFVYSPVLLVVLYLLIRNWRTVPSRPLATLAIFSSASTWLIIASHMDWWGGNCYGPRYLSGPVPWRVMLAIMAIAAMPAGSRRLRSPAVAVGAVLLGVSIVINGHGAFSFATLDWNEKRPLPQVMLDWSQPQFLTGWIDER